MKEEVEGYQRKEEETRRLRRRDCGEDVGEVERERDKERQRAEKVGGRSR